METRSGKGSFFLIVKNFFPFSLLPTGLCLGLQGFAGNAGQAEVSVPTKIWELACLNSASFSPVRYSYLTDSKRNKRDTANSQEKGIECLK